MRLVAAVLAWMLCLCGAAGAHEITFSHVEVRLSADKTAITAQVPIKALLHEDPNPLPPGTTDQSLRGPLSAEAKASLAALVLTRLHLRSGTTPLVLAISQVRPAGDDIAIIATAGPAAGELAVQANLFPDDALHKVFVSVFRGDALAGQYVLDRKDSGFSLAAAGRPLPAVLVSFVEEGIHHIFIGPDHILFVLALVLLGGRLWSQVKIITAFTVAHSITLALATLNIVQAPSRLVESTIALSIVVVGLHDLWRIRRGGSGGGPDLRVAFAFGFGLIHGLGFASVLAELELPRHAVAWSLAAFNVGVEIGQVAIVLAAALPLAALARYAKPRVSRGVLTAAACLVVAAGGFWFTQRAFGAA